jgi:hypothetical protein
MVDMLRALSWLLAVRQVLGVVVTVVLYPMFGLPTETPSMRIPGRAVWVIVHLWSATEYSEDWHLGKEWHAYLVNTLKSEMRALIEKESCDHSAEKIAWGKDEAILELDRFDDEGSEEGEEEVP